MAKRRPMLRATRAQMRRRKKLQHAGYAGPKVTLVKWDARNTLKANYRTLGIADDVNKAVDRALESGEQQAEAESGGEGKGEGALAEELSKVAALEPVPYRVKSMPVKEQKALLALMHKHGENLAAMARDLELNPHQWTEGHLQRRIALYKQLLAL